MIEVDISSYEDIEITEKGASDKILGEEGQLKIVFAMWTQPSILYQLW